MRRGIWLFMIVVLSCSIQKNPSDKQDGRLTLNFSNCSDSSSFNRMILTPPAGYKLSKEERHQFCEYRLTYRDNSILYISTDIYGGSYLNAKNRFAAGIKTYSINRSKNDTIRNSGTADSHHWLEWINGAYVVGYVNVSDTTVFHKAIKSIHLGDQ